MKMDMEMSGRSFKKRFSHHFIRHSVLIIQMNMHVVCRQNTHVLRGKTNNASCYNGMHTTIQFRQFY